MHKYKLLANVHCAKYIGTPSVDTRGAVDSEGKQKKAPIWQSDHPTNCYFIFTTTAWKWMSFIPGKKRKTNLVANIVGCPLSVWFEHLIISWVFIISGLRICCFWHCMRPSITPLFCFSQTSSIVFHQSYLHHQTRMLDREIFTFEFKRKHCLRPHPRRNPLWWFLGFSRIGQKVGFGDFRHFLGFFSDRPLAEHCLPARGWTPSPQSWFGIKQRSAKPHIGDHHFHHHYHQYTAKKSLRWPDN